MYATMKGRTLIFYICYNLFFAGGEQFFCYNMFYAGRVICTRVIIKKGENVGT